MKLFESKKLARLRESLTSSSEFDLLAISDILLRKSEFQRKLSGLAVVLKDDLKTILYLVSGKVGVTLSTEIVAEIGVNYFENSESSNEIIGFFVRFSGEAAQIESNGTLNHNGVDYQFTLGASQLKISAR